MPIVSVIYSQKNVGYNKKPQECTKKDKVHSLKQVIAFDNL